jgi:hypothetical protein
MRKNGCRPATVPAFATISENLNIGIMRFYWLEILQTNWPYFCS